MADEPETGDPVCWLHELCPQCGALPTPDVPGVCWRCGEPAPEATSEAT